MPETLKHFFISLPQILHAIIITAIPTLTILSIVC